MMTQPQAEQQTGWRMPSLGWSILALSAAFSLLWSAHKLLEQDEIFSFQTDRVHSLAEVLRIQRSYPISLEPPPYHVLAHAAMQVFGANAFALRLPAFFGFLAMQVCLFYLVRNLAEERAGLIAMAFPALTSTFFFSAEGRPYGVLLGCYAAVALFWQVGARRGDWGQRRVLPLIALAAVLALTLNVHFYGILLLIPLYGAELVREIRRLRAKVGIDWPMLLAIAAGTASIVLAVPYAKASSEFKKHYYAAAISPHMLTQPYRQMLLDYTHFPHAAQSVLMAGIVLAGAFLAWGIGRALRRREVAIPAAEQVFLALLVLMPVFAYALGKLVTHALEVRHSIGAIVGLCALLGVAVAPALRRALVFRAVLALLLISICVANVQRIRASSREGRAELATMALTSAQWSAIDRIPDQNLYFQNLGEWEVASLYTPDPALRKRLVLVYSRAEEMGREQHDTMYLTAIHTQRFDPAPIVSYDALRRQPGEHTFVVFGGGWSWTAEAFAEEAAQVTPLGPAFGGELVQVRFR